MWLDSHRVAYNQSHRVEFDLRALTGVVQSESAQCTEAVESTRVNRIRIRRNKR